MCGIASCATLPGRRRPPPVGKGTSKNYSFFDARRTTLWILMYRGEDPAAHGHLRTPKLLRPPALPLSTPKGTCHSGSPVCGVASPSEKERLVLQRFSVVLHAEKIPSRRAPGPCTPTRTASMTSRCPFRYGLQKCIPPSSTAAIPTSVPVPPELLRGQLPWWRSARGTSGWPRRGTLGRGFSGHLSHSQGKQDCFTTRVCLIICVLANASAERCGFDFRRRP